MPATSELLQEGRYRINQESAVEGNSIVFEAYDTVRDTNVVVKEIPLRLGKVTTVSQQELMKLAFANQAKTLTEIHHDSLLHVHDYFSEAGRQFLVLESVDGDDLGVLLERNNSAFPVSDVLNWADQMLDALNYLHNFKPPVIHRNVRPEHIKLNSSGKIKLLAFGLAEGFDSKVNTSLSDDTPDDSDICYSPLEQIWDGLDSASQKVITNCYDEKSERILKQPADAGSDIYALGATLYHLLTAEKPLDALERSIEMMDGKDDPLRNANEIDAEIPAEISDVLMKAMAIKREERYDSASIMRQVLRTSLIRVKEREADEGEEPKEAKIDLKADNQVIETSVSGQTSANDAEVQRLKAEEIQKAESAKQLAHDAEEQRIMAEQRAAEAARRIQEEQFVKAALAAHVHDDEPSDDDLLQILLPTSPIVETNLSGDEGFSLFDADETDFNASETFEEQPVLLSETIAEPVETARVSEKQIAGPVKETQDARHHSSVRGDQAAVTDEFEFELPVSKGFPLGMPLIALGIGAVLIVIVAAWVLMPGSSGDVVKPAESQSNFAAEPAASQPAVQSAMPSNTEPAPAAAVTSQPETNTSLTPGQPAQKAKNPTPTPKPAKATPETKKAVTVDDLINDN